ncbi:hypothetical protein BdWA1_002774 [Babesia duncani]|uniref:Uncharacterized protein n=1 Tax=Babesia duncani TaxID=323732 RepID=A0AAD9PK31_9APIC|nr:hypothetical protein BdWA1_002774 [Babesia duncani]
MTEPNRQPRGPFSGFLARWKNRSKPVEEIDLGAISSNQENTLPDLRVEGATELDTHYVSFYDKILKLKDFTCQWTRERVMRFMRHDLDNRPSGSNPDVEGGSSTRGSTATYDSLIFKITLLVGFILRFPLIWIIGSLMFIFSRNFKKSTIRWGGANIALSILTILYASRQWDLIKQSITPLYETSETIRYNMEAKRKSIISTLELNGSPVNIVSITGDSNLQWVEFNKLEAEKQLPIVTSSKEIIFDASTLPNHCEFVMLKNFNFTITGKIQIFANVSKDFKHGDALTGENKNPTRLPRVKEMEKDMNFDIGLACISQGSSNNVYGGISLAKGDVYQALKLKRGYNCYLVVANRPGLKITAVYIKRI